MAPGARLFDLDGTLWDSFAFYGAVAAEQGTITAEAARDALIAGENVVTLMDRLGLGRRALASALARSTSVVMPHDGMAAVLEKLAARGHPLGVVTNLSGSIALPVIERLGLAERFGVVVHAGSGAGRKPSQRPILAALTELGMVASASHVYVGDHLADQEAAEAAGLRFAWAGWGYGTPPRGTAVLRDPAAILEL